MGSTGPAIEDEEITLRSEDARVTSGRTADPPSTRTLRDRKPSAIAPESEVCVPNG
jgi:hypothetical protein